MSQQRMSKARPETWEDPFRLLSRTANKFHNLWLSWTYPFASMGKDVWLHRSCDVTRLAAKYIKIGDRVSLERNVWLNIVGIPDNDEPIIILEDGCKLQRGCVISAKNQIQIQRNTIFGPSVFITDHNHAFEDVTVPIAHQGEAAGGTIRIEEGCWIGFGAAIVGNQGELVIGRNSLVGANSLLTRSVHPYSIVTGNPARTAKHYDPSKERWVLGAAVPAG